MQIHTLFMNLINQVRLECQQGNPLNEEALKKACHIYQELSEQHYALLGIARNMNTDMNRIIGFNNSLGDALHDVCMAFHSNDTVQLAEAVAEAQRRFVPTTVAEAGLASKTYTPETVH